LHSVVGAFAVDAVVRDEVSSVLRAGESGATIGGSHDLTNFDHSSLVRAPTGHISTTNGSRLSTRTSVTILWEGLADGISDAIMDARTLVLRARDHSVLVTAAVVATIAGGERLTDSV